MLITIEQAADRIGGVPKKPLANTALAHGLLIRIGASSYLKESELDQLIEACRVKPTPTDVTSKPQRPPVPRVRTDHLKKGKR